eukprot:6849990-Heterocapsa_arctica.AAC.1
MVIRDVTTMGPPPPEATAFQRELFSYMLVHPGASRRARRSLEAPRPLTTMARSRRVEQLWPF